MVLFLAVASNVFGAVFARLGTAAWITEWLLGLTVPPMLMLIVIVALLFLLGWPFEWPAIVLVFVPIFYPVVSALGIDMIWFGALVAVTLQTAFPPPVAMSGYYLKQVAPAWPLATIFKGCSNSWRFRRWPLACCSSFRQLRPGFPSSSTGSHPRWISSTANLIPTSAAPTRRASHLRHRHAFPHRRPCAHRVVPALDIGKCRQIDAVPFVARDPGINGDVGDGVFAGEVILF